MWFFFSDLLKQNKFIHFLVLLLLDWTFKTLRVPFLDSTSADTDTLIINYGYERLLLSSSAYFNILDIVLLFILKLNFFFKSVLFGNPQNVKVIQLNNNGFYSFNNKNTLFSTNRLFLFGLRSIWGHLRYWLLPLLFACLFVYYSFFLKSLPFTKVLFGYLLLGNMFYLLFSGFVFFVKKYQYRLFTSVIQRFWRRTLVIFWAIEGSLFVVFVYFIFNASQEPINVYDNIQIYKTHFYSWRFFLIKVILSTLLIVLTYMLMLSLKWNTFSKTNNIAFFITVILLYIAWLEFYQLFHLMNCYGNANWVYDFSEHLWNLELEFKRTRIVNHYVTIGLVAKFWHVVFAVVFWIFFVLRGVESSRYRYPLLAANLQNFLIIYIMSWLYMYPWFKYVFRRFMDMPYFWFFMNNRKLGFFLFFNDIKLYIFGLSDFFSSFLFSFNNFFKKHPFYYLHESSCELGNTQFRKHNIRDLFVRCIN